MSGKSLAWPAERLVMDLGKLVRERRITLPGGHRLRYRPEEGTYWLDGLIIARELLKPVTDECTVLGWGPTGADRDSPVQLYGLKLTPAQATALMGGREVMSLFLSGLVPVIRARALTPGEMMAT